jgi:hypothetical protein
MYNARLKKGAQVQFSFPENYNTCFVLIEGSITANEQSAGTDQVVLFNNDGTDIQVEATEDSIVLILSGEPINEPIFPYGPFLMNTREEIIQAYDDLSNGKFGHLGIVNV